MGFRISMATNLRVDLKGIAYIRLTELNKHSPNITGIIPWTVVPAWVKRRRQTEHKHVLLSASWLWMWCDSPPNAIVPSLPGWAVSLDLGARINLPFIKLLLSGICHSDKTKKKKNEDFIAWHRRLKWSLEALLSHWDKVVEGVPPVIRVAKETTESVYLGTHQGEV